MEHIHRETPENYRYVSQPKTRRDMMINHIDSYEKISTYFAVNLPKLIIIIIIIIILIIIII
jgi:hypothetical protein